MNQLRYRNVTGFCCMLSRAFEFSMLRDLDTGHVAIHRPPFVTQTRDLVRLKILAVVEYFKPFHNRLQSPHRHLQPLDVASISARLKC